MRTYIYLLLLTMLTFSCTNDDDGSPNDNPTLGGEWSLVNVSGGLVGLDDDFTEGLITWNFNLEAQELTVTNTNVELVIYDGLPTGVYDYSIETTDDGLILVINNIDYNVVTLTSSSLVLDEGIVADGFLLTYSR